MSIYRTKPNYQIKDRIADSPTQQIIYIGPAQARRFLEKNTRNRPLSEIHVRRLMEEMLSGRWKYNGEPLQWSVDDVILNGQHRLTALSRMDDGFQAIPFLVVRGLPADAQDTMDQVRVRTAGDQLNINGITSDSDGRIIAGAVRVYIQWTEGLLFRSTLNRVSNPQITEWATNHRTEVEIMKDILCAEMRRVKARPSVTLAILLRFTLIDDEAAYDFARALYSGAGLESGNSILTLRERLDRIRSQGVKTPDRDIIAFFTSAWNSWRQGRKLTKFQRPAGGMYTTDTFPKPV